MQLILYDLFVAGPHSIRGPHSCVEVEEILNSANAWSGQGDCWWCYMMPFVDYSFTMLHNVGCTILADKSHLYIDA